MILFGVVRNSLKSRVVLGCLRMIESWCTRAGSVESDWARTAGLGLRWVNLWIVGPWSGVYNGPESRVGPSIREG
jgi:hypothetical protein